MSTLTPRAYKMTLFGGSKDEWDAKKDVGESMI